MCEQCADLFHPVTTLPATSAARPAADTARDIAPPAPATITAIQISVLLLGIGLVMLVVARILAAILGDLGGPLVRELLWAISIAAMLVGIFGLARLIWLRVSSG